MNIRCEWAKIEWKRNRQQLIKISQEKRLMKKWKRYEETAAVCYASEYIACAVDASCVFGYAATTARCRQRQVEKSSLCVCVCLWFFTFVCRFVHTPCVNDFETKFNTPTHLYSLIQTLASRVKIHTTHRHCLCVCVCSSSVFISNHRFNELWWEYEHVSCIKHNVRFTVQTALFNSV